MLTSHKDMCKTTDEKLFEDSEFEGLLWTEEEWDAMLRIFDWAQAGPRAVDDDNKAHTTQAQQHDHAWDGAMHVNISTQSPTHQIEMNDVDESYYLDDDYALLFDIDSACGMDMDVTCGLADGVSVPTAASASDGQSCHRILVTIVPKSGVMLGR